MKLRSANLADFTVFGSAKFEFCDGVNVIIGANATGKTHLLKLLYTACAASPKRAEPKLQAEKFEALLSQKLASVFRPNDDDLSRLVRRGCNQASFAVDWQGEKKSASGTLAAQVSFKIGDDGLFHLKFEHKDAIRSVFIPSREVLAMFPGFIPAYEERELAFDETYFDICKALMHNRLKTRKSDRVKLVETLEQVLGGSVVLDGMKFYVRQAGEKGRGTEAQLVSEGMRKLAMLAHLIHNGAVQRQGIVFWDEPESSLNPGMIPVMAKVLAGIAEMGIQVFIATHDYLLTRELSLMAEYGPRGKGKAPSIKFFCLSKDAKTGGVVPDQGDVLADLDKNPILEEFVAHYEREQGLFSGS
jgi:predicted ATPase